MHPLSPPVARDSRLRGNDEDIDALKHPLLSLDPCRFH